jgi:cytochrome d ubiquinol oxidase subunit II
LYPVSHDALTLSAGLRSHASPLLVVAAGAGVAVMILLYRRSFSVARVSAAVAVAAVITGWGVGQYPWMLVEKVTIADAAGAEAALGDCWWSSGWPPSSCCPRWGICCGSPRPRNRRAPEPL